MAEFQDFDQLATAYAEGSLTRRRLLQGLLAGAGVAMLTPILGLGRADAAPGDCTQGCKQLFGKKARGTCIKECSACQRAGDQVCNVDENGHVTCCPDGCEPDNTCHKNGFDCACSDGGHMTTCLAASCLDVHEVCAGLCPPSETNISLCGPSCGGGGD
jgi:hypothetical protein